MSQDFDWWAVIVTFVCGMYFFTGPNLAPWKKDYTIYVKECKDLKSDEFKCTEGFYYNAIKFMPLLERQAVAFTYPDRVVVWVERYDDCKVVDARDWECKKPSNDWIKMKEGKYFDTSNSATSSLPTTSQIWRITYYFGRAKSLLD